MSAPWISTWSQGSLFWISSLWRASWQGGLFILAVWAVCRLFPRLPAAIAAWLWWLACLKLLVGLASPAPLTVSLLPGLRPSAPRSRISPARLPRLDTDAATDVITGLKSAWYTGLPAARPHARHPSPGPSAAPARGDAASPSDSRVPGRVTIVGGRPTVLHGLGLLLLAFWAAGVAVRLRAAVRQWLVLRRLVREARPVADPGVWEEAAQVAAALGLRRLPPLRESAAAPGPVVVGPLRPVILLPVGVAEPLSPRERRMVLAHELAHVRRGDLGLALVPGLAQALFFFHPLVVLAGREWGTAREAACDAAALKVTGAPVAVYGRLLLKLVASQRGAALPALAATGGYRAMERRLTMLRDLSDRPQRWLRVSLALLIALTTIGALPLRLAAVESQPRGRFAIESVKELAKPITLTETKIPLGELVEKVAAETGVSLSAAPDVADEPVAAVVKDLPAGRLLSEIAALLDYRWSRRAGPRGERYEIWQDLVGKQREEALCQALFLDAEKRFQEKIARLLAMATQPPERIREISDAFENDPAVRDLPVNSPERKGWEDRAALASQVAGPIPRALAFLLGRLAAQQWSLLRADQPVIFSTDPGPGELAMPEEIARTFRGSRPAWLLPGQKDFLGHSPHADQLREAMSQAEKETQSRWAAATGYRAVIRVEGNRLQPGGFLSLTARAEPLRGGAPDRLPSAVGTSLMQTVGMGDPLMKREENTPERQAALAKDPVVGAAKPFRTEKKGSIETVADESGRWTMRRDWAGRRWDQLPELARTYGADFIADAYWSSALGVYLPRLPSSSEPTPLYKLLDTLAGSTHHWDRRGHLIRLRSRSWFLERPREIPMRLVRRWNGRLEQQGALPLEEYLQMVTTLLNDVQLDSLSQLAFQGELAASLPDLRAVTAGRDALRLYAALTPDQRQALWRGLPVPAAAMTPAQRDLFRAALERTQSKDAVLSPAEMAAARVSLTAQPQVLVVEQRPGGITYQVQSPPTASGAPLATPQPGAASGAPHTGAAPKPGTVKRYPVAQLTFHYQVGGQPIDLSPLTVAAPGPLP